MPLRINNYGGLVMYNLLAVLMGGVVGLMFIGVYLMFTSQLVVEPLIENPDSYKLQLKFSNKALWSLVIACAVVFAIVLIASFFSLNLAARLFLLTFMASAVFSLLAIIWWLIDNRKRLAKLQQKWFHKPLLASTIITLLIVIIFFVCTL